MSLVLDGTNGISGCPAVSSAGSDIPPLMQDNAGKTASCRAWVSFVAGATPSINAAFNVSSITRQAIGLYAVNFTNAMSDNHYAWSMSAGTVGGTSYLALQYATLTASSIGINIENLAGTGTDVGYNTVAIFR